MKFKNNFNKIIELDGIVGSNNKPSILDLNQYSMFCDENLDTDDFFIEEKYGSNLKNGVSNKDAFMHDNILDNKFSKSTENF